MTLIRAKSQYQTQRAMYLDAARAHLAEAARLRTVGDQEGARCLFRLAQRARKRAAVMCECIRDIDDFMAA